jgi:hypothetical protein
MEEERRYEVGMRLMEKASSLRSLPIEGRAILTAERDRGVRKEESVVRRRATLFVLSSSTLRRIKESGRDQSLGLG